MSRPGLLRFSLWWQHIVPPVLAAAYVATATGALPPGELLAKLPLFLVSIVGIAGFGYFLNDACDIAADRAAGKANAAAASGPLARAAILLGLLVVGLAPWSLLPRNPVNLTLLALQVAVLTLYSTRPVPAQGARPRRRPRGHPLWPPPAGGDRALHLLSAGPSGASGRPGAGCPVRPAQSSSCSFVVLVFACKGLRNILLHQLGDRENDRRAGIRTFVLAAGPVRALALIDRLLLPLEFGALVAVLVLLAPAAPVWVGFAAFLAFTALMFSAWKFPYLPRRQLRFKFLYFLNDFYEEWLPPTALAIAVARHTELWPLLPLHFALFPKGLAKLPRQFAVLRENFASAGDF